VLFSGTLRPRNVRRIVELGDGWIPIMREQPDRITHGVALLHDALAEADRPPQSLIVRVDLPTVVRDCAPSVSATISCASALLEAGATDVVLRSGPFLLAGQDPGRFLAAAVRA
jgi:hypothetical protein